jgi:hypothetical protein
VKIALAAALFSHGFGVAHAGLWNTWVNKLQAGCTEASQMRHCLVGNGTRKGRAMRSSNFIRWGGLAGMLGGILGMLIPPFLGVAWFATKGSIESLENPLVAVWAEPFVRIFSPLLTFASPDTVYMTYGRVALFIFLGFLAGLLALHARQAPHAGQFEKWGFRVALVGSVLTILGIIGAFWVGTFWVAALDFSYFAFLFPGQLLVTLGWTLFGIGTLNAKVAPRLGAWLLIVGGFPGFIVIAQLLGQHNSMGGLLVALAWIVLGYALWSARDMPAGQSSHAR